MLVSILSTGMSWFSFGQLPQNCLKKKHLPQALIPKMWYAKEYQNQLHVQTIYHWSLTFLKLRFMSWVRMNAKMPTSEFMNVKIDHITIIRKPRYARLHLYTTFLNDHMYNCPRKSQCPLSVVWLGDTGSRAPRQWPLAVYKAGVASTSLFNYNGALLCKFN